MKSEVLLTNSSTQTYAISMWITKKARMDCWMVQGVQETGEVYKKK